MIALATLTKPGPSAPQRTRLAASSAFATMAASSLWLGSGCRCRGFVEISAVCTHPDYRGRGYGAALMRAVGDRILAESDTPFLHAYASNTGAIALYKQLGFAPRAEVTHAMWSKA